METYLKYNKIWLRETINQVTGFSAQLLKIPSLTLQYPPISQVPSHRAALALCFFPSSLNRELRHALAVGMTSPGHNV